MSKSQGNSEAGWKPAHVDEGLRKKNPKLCGFCDAPPLLYGGSNWPHIQMQITCIEVIKRYCYYYYYYY